MNKKNILVAIIAMIMMVVCGNNAAAQSVKIAGLDQSSSLQALKNKSESGSNGVTWLDYTGNRNIQLEILGATTDDGAAFGGRLIYMTRPWTFSAEYRYAENRSALLAGINFDFVKSPYSAFYPGIEILGGIGEQYLGYQLQEDFSGGIKGSIKREFLICKMKPQAEARLNLKIVPFRKYKQLSFTLFGGVIGRFSEGKISANNIKSNISIDGAKVDEVINALGKSEFIKPWGWTAGLKISHLLLPWGSKKKAAEKKLQTAKNY